MHRLDRRDIVRRVLERKDFPLSVIGDTIKVFRSLISRETLKI
jgi:hypothetical protein